MRSFQKLLSLSFFSLIIINSSFAHGANNPNAYRVDANLEKWCKSTSYPDICVSTIAPYMNGKKPDLFTVLGVALNSTAGTTKMAITLGKKMTNSPQGSALKSKLSDALNNYRDALDNFNQAKVAVAQRDWGTANIMISASLTNLDDCNGTLKGENAPVLIDLNGKLTKMTSNCLALESLLDPRPI